MATTRGQFFHFDPIPLSSSKIEQSIWLLVALACSLGIWCRPVTREQHADVHFVGLRFEPVEVALHAIPRPRPLMVFVDAVILVAVDDPALMFGGKFVERHVHLGMAGFANFSNLPVTLLRYVPTAPAFTALAPASTSGREREIVNRP